MSPIRRKFLETTKNRRVFIILWAHKAVPIECGTDQCKVFYWYGIKASLAQVVPIVVLCVPSSVALSNNQARRSSGFPTDVKTH